MEIMSLQPSAMDQALNNPIILGEIFQNDVGSAKNVRLVCKLWNEIVLSQPEPKLRLLSSIKNEPIPCGSESFHTAIFRMNPRLARSIKLWDPTNPTSLVIMPIPVTAAKLLHVCDKFSDHVQFLTLIVAEGLISTLYYVLQNSCPNLKNLGLTIKEGTNEVEKQLATMTPLNFRPNLHRIKIDMNKDIPTTMLQHFVQLLVNATPNLDSLTLPYRLYLDLSVNKTLRTLSVAHYVYIRSDQDDWPGNSLKGLLRMLNQVASHLEFLDIRNDGYSYHQEVSEENKLELIFKMPLMPKLKSFNNALNDVLTCGESLQYISCSRLKSLRSLSLGNVDRNIDILLNSISDCKNLFYNGTSGVTRLFLEGVRKPDSLSRLKIPFPMLKSLKVSAAFDNVSTLELGPTLEACSSLGLQHLIIDDLQRYVGDPIKVSDIIKDFANNCQWLKTLKTLHVGYRRYKNQAKNNNRMTKIDTDRFKQVLMTFGGMESVIFCEIFGDEIVGIIQPFIEENKLPVKFMMFDRKPPFARKEMTKTSRSWLRNS